MSKIKSKIIIANAGSGKTYSIVQHIKEIIEAGFQPSSILCITFTNPGRDEMQNRLQKDIPNLKSLPKIVTFHSLCKEIIDTFTHELNMPYDYTIVDSDAELSFEIENALLTSKLFQKFITDFKISPSAFSNIIASFYKEYHKLNTSKEYRLVLIREIFELEGDTLSSSQTKEKILSDVLQSIPTEMLQSVGGSILEKSLPKIYEIAKKYEEFAIDSSAIKDVEDLCILAGKSTKKNTDYVIYKEFLKNSQSQLQNIITFEKCYALNDIAGEIISEIEKIKKKLRKYTFNDLIHKALEILENPELRDFAIFKFGSTFAHILVDEAQDTNEYQWQVLSHFIEEQVAYGMEKSSLFIVGDTKQTIYSFQGAKSTIMEEVYTKYSQFLERHFLTKSFRTTQPVLDVINNLPFLNNEQKHISHFEQNKGLRDGFVEIIRINQKIDEEYAYIAQKTVEFVKSLIGKQVNHEKYHNKILEPRDFAILLKKRSGKVISALKDAFFQARIPISFSDKIDYRKSFCILDFIAILKLCIISYDNLSLYGLLKSPIFNIDENDFEVEFHHEFQQNIENNLLLEKFPSVNVVIEKFREILNNDGIFIFFKRIFAEFGQNYSKHEQNILESFFKTATNCDQYNPIKFIQEFEASDATHIIQNSANNTNAITCTTIHSSKGLEYPIVIYIEAHGERSKNDIISIQNGIILYLSSQKKRGKKMQEIIDIEKEKTFAEDLRLYYVAISRAAFGFCCISSFSHSEKEESFFRILERSLSTLKCQKIQEEIFDSKDDVFDIMVYDGVL